MKTNQLTFASIVSGWVIADIKEIRSAVCQILNISLDYWHDNKEACVVEAQKVLFKINENYRILGRRLDIFFDSNSSTCYPPEKKVKECCEDLGIPNSIDLPQLTNVIV